jgi:hypothetical protein
VGFGRKIIQGAVFYRHVEVNPDIGDGRRFFLLFPQLDKYVIYDFGGGFFYFYNGIGELPEAGAIILEQPAERLFITIHDALKLCKRIFTYMV